MHGEMTARGVNAAASERGARGLSSVIPANVQTWVKAGMTSIRGGGYLLNYRFIRYSAEFGPLDSRPRFHEGRLFAGMTRMDHAAAQPPETFLC